MSTTKPRRYTRESFRDWLKKRDVDDEAPIAEFMGFQRFPRLRSWLTDPACHKQIAKLRGEGRLSRQAVIDWLDDQIFEGHT